MIPDVLIRLLFASLAALILIPGGKNPSRQRGGVTNSEIVLIGFVCNVVLFLIRIPQGRLSIMAQDHLCFLFNYAGYSLILLALTPILRKRFSALLCANLWLIPMLGYLYLLFLTPLRPFAILRIDGGLFWALFGVWAAGFLAVMSWKIVAHLRFRRKLLRNAAGDEHLSYIYSEQRYLVESDYRREAWLPNKDHVLYSPDAASPLSIGLFKGTTRIVLPRRYYTEEELYLILRHEVLHLMRGDNRTKLFLTLLTAGCWFLPSLWLGVSHAAEDMELCCDELATEYLKPEERKRYASLLLSNAGPAAGFTTCLSATAAGLRYRLQRILHPNKARYDRWVAAIMMFVFLFGIRAVGIAPGAGTVETVAFSAVPTAAYAEQINWPVNEMRESDAAALREALASVELYRADGYVQLDYGMQDVRLTANIIDSDRAVIMEFYETYVIVTELEPCANETDGKTKATWYPPADPEGRGWKQTTEHGYYYGATPDWDLLYSLAGAPLK